MIRRSFLGSLCASIVAGATAVRAKAKAVAVPPPAPPEPATTMIQTFEQVTPTIGRIEIEHELDSVPISLYRFTRGKVNADTFLGSQAGTVKLAVVTISGGLVAGRRRTIAKCTFLENREGWADHHGADFGLLPMGRKPMPSQADMQAMRVFAQFYEVAHHA